MLCYRAVFVALALSSSTFAAQSQVYTRPIPVRQIGTATLNAATGVLSRGPRSGKSGALVAPAFVNTDTSGLYGRGDVTSSTTGNPIEYLDFGVVTIDTGSDIVGRFTFGYGTSMTDTSQGGPGASVTLRFYDGITGFCADSGAAPTASFSFSGLPGASPGTNAGWLVTVDLVGGFEFNGPGAGNNFGFGFTSLDDLEADSVQNTGPLLCYAGDPNGVNMDATRDADSNGQLDVFDLWDETPGSNLCLGTFFYGGTPLNYSSWYLLLETADTSGAPTASATFRNCGSNPGNFIVSSPPVVGRSLGATDTSSSGGIGVIVVGYSTPDCISTRFGNLLVLPQGGDFFAGYNGLYLFSGGVASINVPVANNLLLVGLTFSAQAIEVGGGIEFHNANDLVFGY